MHDALDNLIRQPVDMPLNPLFFQRVKKELRELLEEHRAVLIEQVALKEEIASLKGPQASVASSADVILDLESKPPKGRPRK